MSGPQPIKTQFSPIKHYSPTSFNLVLEEMERLFPPTVNTAYLKLIQPYTL